MIIPLLAFIGAVLLAAYFALRWDAEDRKAIHTKQKDTSPTLWSLLVLPLLPCLGKRAQVAPQQIQQIEMTTISHAEGGDSTTTVALSSEELALRRELKKRERKAFQMKLKGKSVGSEHSILDDPLPQVFRNNTYVEKISAELKRHHRWLGVVYHYSEVFPRALRVLSLGSNILCTLYFISLTYGQLNPDNNNCSTLSTEDACLEPKSHFHTGQAQCTWDNSTEQCSLIQPNILIRVILVVVVFAVMLSIPVNIVINYLIQYVLAAPLRSRISGSNSNSGSKYAHVEGGGDNMIPVYSSGDIEHGNHTQTLHIVKHKPYNSTPSPEASPPESPHNTNTNTNTNTNNNHNTNTHTNDTLDAPVSSTTPLLNKYKTRRDNAQRDLDALQREVRRHRELFVKGIIERRTFDRVWGLTPSGHFITPTLPKHTAPCTTHFLHYLHHFALHYTPLCYTPCVRDEAQVRTHLYGDILRTQRAEKRTIEAIKALFPSDGGVKGGFVSEHEVGKVLILNLYVDLLPPTPGLILQCKSSRDSVLVVPVWWVYQFLALCVVVAVDAYFLYSLFMFSATQSAPRQTAWFKSFMLFIVLDCVGLATNSVLSSHVIIPALAVVHVQRVKEWLIERVQRYDTNRAKMVLTSKQIGNGKSKGSGITSGGGTGTYAGASAIDTANTTGNTNNTNNTFVPLTPLSPPSDVESGTTSTTFNAAKYLYTSYRLSLYFPTLHESNIVHLCNTQVPRQAMCIERSVSESNNTTVLSVVLYICYVCIMPCVHVVLQLPLFIQDAYIDYITIALFGYILLLHMRLYSFYPPLAFVPPFVGLVLTHFYVVSSNGETTTRLATLKRQTLAARAEQRKLNNKIVVVESGASGGTPYDTNNTTNNSSSHSGGGAGAVGSTIPTTANTTNTTNNINTNTISGSIKTTANNNTNTTTTTLSTRKAPSPVPALIHGLYKTNTASSMYSVGSVGSSIHSHSPHTNHNNHQHNTTTNHNNHQHNTTTNHNNNTTNNTNTDNTTNNTTSPSTSPVDKESRLKHFLESADKVLQQPSPNRGRDHSSGSGAGSGGHNSSFRSYSPVNVGSTNTTTDTATNNTSDDNNKVKDNHPHNSSTTTVGTSFNTLNNSAYATTHTTNNNTTSTNVIRPIQQHSWSNLKSVDSFTIPTTDTTGVASAGISGSTGTIGSSTTAVVGSGTSGGTSGGTSSADSPNKGKRLVKKASRPAMSSGSGGIGTISGV